MTTESVEKTRFYNPPLKEQLSQSGDPEEEARAREAIEHFVTNPDGAIYALTPYIPELFAALITARYSRTELSARQLVWREFVSQKEKIPWQTINQGMGALRGIFNFARAHGLAERILSEYGDDSVFELGGAHIFFDRVSQIAAKVIEDARIGISPLEKSTRYVIFDQKGPDGDYSFFKEPKIIESSHGQLYLDTTRGCFEFYAQSVASLQDYYRQQIPIESQQFPELSIEVGSNEKSPLRPFVELKDDRSIRAARAAYNASVRAKACDVARVLLPASTLTNIGEFGNARALGYLMTKMMASPLAEMQMIAVEGTRELESALPKFFDVVENERGQEYQNFLRKTEAILQKRAKDLLASEAPEKAERVEIIVADPNPEITIAAGLLYPYSDLPLRQIISILQKANRDLVGDILRDSLKFRTNRRHKPMRAFELAGYELLFDVLGNFGIYRDLQRQRMLTQQRQPYGTEHGFDMPVEFNDIGLDKDFVNLMEEVNFAHGIIEHDFPNEAQYLTVLANYMRWYMGMNLREGFWVTELRSIPQGHFSYRTVAQDMAIKTQDLYPFLKGLQFGEGQFVDMSDRSKNLERMAAQQRIQIKLAQIEERYS